MYRERNVLIRTVPDSGGVAETGGARLRSREGKSLESLPALHENAGIRWLRLGLPTRGRARCVLPSPVQQYAGCLLR